MSKKTFSRRKSLKMVAAGLSATSLAGISAAGSSEDTARERARSLIRQNRPSEAVAILESAGIPHTHDRNFVPVSDDPTAQDVAGGVGGVSTQDYFTKRVS